MIKILIVDDDSNKAGKIVSVLNSMHGCEYETVSDLVAARRVMAKETYDLLILDMNLPERFNELPKQDKGLEFVNELKQSQRLKIPKHIICLTAYNELFDRYEKALSLKAIFLIKYDNIGIDWQNILRAKIEHLVMSESIQGSDENYIYDVAIISALRTPELEPLLDKAYNWEKFKLPNDSSNYHRGVIKIDETKNIKIVATNLPQMGMVAAANTSTKIINFFKPRFLIMVGICGGIKGKVNLGDIVIADLSFDFGSGKIVKTKEGEEKFEPDFKSIQLSSDYKEDLIDLATQKTVLRAIKDKWKGNNIANEINLVLGPVGSGGAVISNSSYTEKIIEHQRKLVAIDMETFSIFYCCQYSNNPKPVALSIKAVCDYADHEKNDDMQKYCSVISVEMAEYVIKHILKFA